MFSKYTVSIAECLLITLREMKMQMLPLTLRLNLGFLKKNREIKTFMTRINWLLVCLQASGNDIRTKSRAL